MLRSPHVLQEVNLCFYSGFLGLKTCFQRADIQGHGCVKPACSGPTHVKGVVTRFSERLLPGVVCGPAGGGMAGTLETGKHCVFYSVGREDQ